MSIRNKQDIDTNETREWLDALAEVFVHDGSDRAQYLLQKLFCYASQHNCSLVPIFTTPYRNTISIEDEIKYPGNLGIEHSIQALIRWNAVAMVVRAVKKEASIGGHIGTYASSATLYEVGFNHFWRGTINQHPGDLLYIQGHASPGIYARSFLEGRLSEEQLENFRREVDHNGLSSYPHPWLMPSYWQFPTVSMGLGPLQAIYQARFIRYLEHREIIKPSDRKVWCFCGDGEMDEPESLGALTVAAREKLDNLIFVVNCNLQRLDGPVRGNGNIIQELESVFKGAGWYVIKVVWGSNWDQLFAKDHDGLLQKIMDETIDGEYQNCKAHGGAYTREKFFGKHSKLKKLVADMSDDDISNLKRGGHDSQKIYTAYHMAVNHQKQPVVILAKTVKGYGLGQAGEALNTAHNIKKMSIKHLKNFRDRFNIPIPDKDIEQVPFYRLKEDSPEIQYLHSQRQKLGGYLPTRRVKSDQDLVIPNLDVFDVLLKNSGNRQISTTMAFVRVLTILCKQKELGQRIVPIVPDEARTFGIESLFRQIGIYASTGQLYKPVDVDQIMYYREDTKGQILEEGLSESGAFCSWLAAATSYSNQNQIMIPFYIFYSMFGFQRIGDFAWAAGDSRARGFLIGATSGRTTLNGEGLQHEDGQSHVLASVIPNCRAYDPCFSYELAVIIQYGLVQMIKNQVDEFYYITTMNENYHQPDMPKIKDIEKQIIQGIYLFSQKDNASIDLLGSGTILLEVIEAQKILAKDYNTRANVWSVTSFNELAKNGQKVEHHNRLSMDKKPQQAFIDKQLNKSQIPVIAATDYIRAYAEQIRAYLQRPYYVLGTDGFGRSASRKELRSFFEVDRFYITYTALYALYQQNRIDVNVLARAAKSLGIDSKKIAPIES